MNTSNQLNRSLGYRHVLVMVIANVIGSGVYKKVAPMAAALHAPGWVLVCWLLGGIISLLGALCNAEVAGLLAATGGEYVYYQKIYNRFFSFIFGWSLFSVIQTAAISALAYVFAESLQNMLQLPALFASLSGWSIGGVFFPFAAFTVKLLAIILILLLTWINSLGVKTGTGVSAAILLMVFSGIFIIVCFGLTSSSANISAAFSFTTTENTPVPFSAVFTAMLAAFWGYQGWASTGYIGGEIKDARRNLPKAIATGMLVIIVLYLMANITYLSLLPLSTLEAIARSGTQIAAVEAVRIFWGSHGAFYISLLICVTTLGCANSTILTSCRTYFAMAGDKLFFKKAGQLNKANVPANSLLYQGVWASILVLSGSFDQLTDMIIFAIFIYYGATTLGVFILRRKMPDAERPYKVWGYPLVPAIVLLFCALLFFNTIVARPREAAIGMVLMLSGVPLYFWFNRKAANIPAEI